MSAEDMTGAELAEHYFARRDELVADSEPVEAGQPDRLDVVFSLRLTRAEAELIRASAEAAGMKPGPFTRLAAVEAARSGAAPIDAAGLAAILDQIADRTHGLAASLRRTA